MEEIIHDIESLRGQEVSEFGEPKTLDNKNDFDPLLIDTVDVLKKLESNEVTDYTAFNPETEEEIIFDELDEYIDYIENQHGINELLHSNTFNGSAPISNHLDFSVFKFDDEFMGEKAFVEMKAHRGFGDVRANYTDRVLLEFESLDDFYEKFLDSGINEVEFEIDNREFLAVSSINDNIFEISEKTSDSNYDHVMDHEGYADLEDLKINLAEHLDIDIEKQQDKERNIDL